MQDFEVQSLRVVFIPCCKAFIISPLWYIIWVSREDLSLFASSESVNIDNGLYHLVGIYLNECRFKKNMISWYLECDIQLSTNVLCCIHFVGFPSQPCKLLRYLSQVISNSHVGHIWNDLYICELSMWWSWLVTRISRCVSHSHFFLQGLVFRSRSTHFVLSGFLDFSKALLLQSDCK